MSIHYFVRHGEAVPNLSPDIIYGRSNTAPLTNKGEWQAALFGERIRNQKFTPDYVLHSGATRAESTARIALSWAGCNLPMHRDDRLQEISMGKWEGVKRIKVYTPEMVAYLERVGIYGDLPTVETPNEVQNRMWESLTEAHMRNPDGTFLVFGHGFSIRALVGKIQELDRDGIRGLTTKNLSVTKIEVVDKGAACVAYVGERYIR